MPLGLQDDSELINYVIKTFINVINYVIKASTIYNYFCN